MFANECTVTNRHLRHASLQLDNTSARNRSACRVLSSRYPNCRRVCHDDALCVVGGQFLQTGGEDLSLSAGVDSRSVSLAELPGCVALQAFWPLLLNTLRIVVFNLLAILVSASFCGYGFARIRFPGRDLWFGIVLATLMIPYFVLMVPLFIMFSRLGWVDTFSRSPSPYFFGGGAFNIFLFRQFFRSLPEELADADA